MSSSPCPDCAQPLQIVAEHCPHCARPGRYPNVLLASQAADVAALDDRLQKAEASARSRGATTNVQDFSAALAGSKAVIARPRGELERLASNDNQIYATYYQLIDAEARVPDDDKWDALRRGTDEALFPGQKEKIRFAALTLEPVGVINYGACQMTLRTPMIEHRASVFEENTAVFMEKNEIKIKDAPASAVGFRAPWDDRAKVCVAKLADEITPATTPGMHSGFTSPTRRFCTLSSRSSAKAAIWSSSKTSRWTRSSGASSRRATRRTLSGWCCAFSTARFPTTPAPTPPRISRGCCRLQRWRSTSSAFLLRLIDVQPAIKEVRNAWSEIPTEFLASGADRARAQRLMVREGVFRGLVKACAEGSRADPAIERSLQRPGIKALSGHLSLFQAWTARLPLTSAEARETEALGAEPPSEERNSPAASPPFNKSEVFEIVKSQKAEIVRALDRYDMTRARSLVDELVAYQLDHGGAEFAVKSLCDLAKQAQRRCLVEAQVELTARAVGLGPHDGWAWSQRGKALLDAHKLPEALEACERAVSYFDDVPAKNGRAEVLKALGRFDDALTAYDQITREHPDNVVAKNGRTEVLKALGRFDDALKAYDLIRREHPSDVMAKTGRAEVLKGLGRFDDALKAYDLIGREHPDNVVAKNGRAEVLKALGRFDDALKAYDLIRREHPDNIVAKNGRAEVFKTLGRFDDALKAYEQTGREHPGNVVSRSGMACVLAALGRSREALELLSDKPPGSEQDWIGFHIRGMILLRSGKVDEAITIFERGTADSPGALHRDYYRNALALARLHLRDYAAAASVLEQIRSPLLRTQTTVLRIHSFGAQGQFARVAEAYKQLPQRTPPVIVDLLEELRRRYVDRRPPLHDDAWLLQRELDYDLAFI